MRAANQRTTLVTTTPRATGPTRKAGRNGRWRCTWALVAGACLSCGPAPTDSTAQQAGGSGGATIGDSPVLTRSPEGGAGGSPGGGATGGSGSAGAENGGASTAGASGATGNGGSNAGSGGSSAGSGGSGSGTGCAVPQSPNDTVCGPGDQEDAWENRAVCAARDLRLGHPTDPAEGAAPALAIGDALAVTAGLCRGTTDWFRLHVSRGESFELSFTSADNPVRVVAYVGPDAANDPAQLTEIAKIRPNNLSTQLVAETDGVVYFSVQAWAGQGGTSSYTLTVNKADFFECPSPNAHGPYDDMSWVGGLREGEQGCLKQLQEFTSDVYLQVQVARCVEGQLSVAPEDDCLTQGYAEPSCSPDSNLGRMSCVDASVGFTCSHYGLLPGQSKCADGWLIECFSNDAGLFDEHGLDPNSPYDPNVPNALYNPEGATLEGDNQPMFLNCADPSHSGYAEPRTCAFDQVTGRRACVGDWYPAQGGSPPTNPESSPFPAQRSVVSCVDPIEEGGMSWVALDTVGTIYTPHDVLRAQPLVEAQHARGLSVLGYYGWITWEQTVPHYSRDYTADNVADPHYSYDLYNLHGIELMDPDCYTPLSDQVLPLRDGDCNHQTDARRLSLSGASQELSACRQAMQEALTYAMGLSIEAGLDGVVWDVATWGDDCFAPEYVSGFVAFLNDDANVSPARRALIDEELSAASTGMTTASLDWVGLLVARGGTDSEPELGAVGLEQLWRQWERYRHTAQRAFAQSLRSAADTLSGYDEGNPDSRRFVMGYNRYTNGEAFLFDDLADLALAETFLGEGDPNTGAGGGDDVPYPLTTLESTTSAFLSRDRRFWSWNSPDLGDDRTELFAAEMLATGGLYQTPFCHIGFHCPCGESSSCEYSNYDRLDYPARDRTQDLMRFVNAHADWLDREAAVSELAVYWSLPSTGDVAQLQAMRMTDRLLRRHGHTVDVQVSGSADWLVPGAVGSSTLSAYPALVVAGARSLGEDQVQSLLDYAAGGGTLVVVGPAGTEDVFGDTPDSTTARNQWLALMVNGSQSFGSGTVHVATGTTPLSSYGPDVAGRGVADALNQAWRNEPDLRDALSAFIRDLLETAGVTPRHATPTEQIHISRHEDASGVGVVHLVNYAMAGRAGTTLVSELAGVCEQRSVVYADALPVLSGSFEAPLTAAVESSGGTITLARLGEVDLSLTVTPGHSSARLELDDESAQVVLTVDPGETPTPCGSPTRACAALGEGLKTWWLLRFEP